MSTEPRSSRWLVVVLGAISLGVWAYAGGGYMALQEARADLEDAQAQWENLERQWAAESGTLVEEINGLKVAIAEVEDTIEIEDLNPRGRFIAVSLHERWLELRDADSVIWTAPVAIGRGFRDEERQVFFSTPRGRREVLSMTKNPVWIPPAWHYREVSSSSGGRTVDLKRGGAVKLSDGSKVVVKGNSVGRVSTDGKFQAYRPGKDVVVDGKVIIPPFGTVQRRKSFVMGTRKLSLGTGYAIHGTNKPWSIGRAASHGCLRMMNKDIEELYTMVEVGTPVFIY